MSRRTCTHEDCTGPVVGRKLCRTHYQRAWKAGEFENAPLPPRVAGRTVCPPEHKHGESSTCYIQHQCRCVPCKAAHSVMENRRNREKAYGRFDTGLVDAEPVREHMLMLGEFGLGYKRVAGLAGVGITAARNVLWGRQEPGPRYGEIPKRIKRENAKKILAVRPDLDALAGGALIPSRGTQRRVQALVALGWSLSEIGRRIGMDISNVGTMLQRAHVTVATHRAVAQVFDELCMTPAPAEEWRQKISRNRALGYAAARRWLAPLAWDDIDMDAEPPMPDEVDEVDETAITLALAGENVRLTPSERREAVTRAHSWRWSDGRSAETLNVTERTVLRIRQELGLEAFEQGELVKAGAA